jgi:hypothetical protein
VKSFLIFFSFFLALPSFGQSVEHTLVRRVSVFPIEVPEELSNKADEVWWELRSFLTKDKRFLVATKNFLQQQNVYQPRSELDPAAAIILGKLLDADAVMTTYLKDRTLHMAAYESKFGRPLWTKEISLQPSLPIIDQLSPGTMRLAHDFLASIPYQGFVTVDPLKDGPVFQDGKRLLFKADVGLSSEAEVGDQAELIHVRSDKLKPVFSDETAVEVYGQGRIVAVDRDVITVELQRLTHASEVKEKALVRLPKELRRLEQQFSMGDPLKNKINTEFLSPEITPTKESVAEHKPLIASIIFIVNLAAFFMIAF